MRKHRHIAYAVPCRESIRWHMRNIRAAIMYSTFRLARAMQEAS